MFRPSLINKNCLGFKIFILQLN